MNKHKFLILRAMLAVCLMLCAGGAWAKDVPVDALYAVYSDGTLTFKKCKVKNESGEYSTGKVFMLWDNSDGDGKHDYTYNKKILANQITKIIFHESMENADIEAFNALDNGTLTVNKLFKNLPYLTSISMGKNGTTSSGKRIYHCYFNLSNVTNLSELFEGCSSLKTVTYFTECLSKAKNVTNVSYMFSGCTSLEEIDLSTLDVSNVTTFAGMFNSCSNLKNIIGLGSWQNEKAESFHMMFSECTSLSYIDLHGFNTSKVTSMYAMFCMSTATPKLKAIYVGSNWNTSNVTSSNYMFENCTGLRNFSSSYITKTYAHTGTYGYLTLLPETEAKTPYAILYQNGSLNFYYDNQCGTDEKYFIFVDGAASQSWLRKRYEIKTVSFSNNCFVPKSCYAWFLDCTALTEVDMSNLSLRKATTMAYMFSGCTSLSEVMVPDYNYYSEYWYAPECTNYDYMFNNCKALNSIKSEKTYKIKLELGFQPCTMSHMFDGCSHLSSFPIYQSDFSKVTDLSYTFNGCNYLMGDQSIKLDNTVTKMNDMFRGCSNITSISIDKSDKASSTNTSFDNLTDCARMFMDCKLLTTVYFNCYNASPTNSWAMFYNCPSLEKIYIKLNTAGNPNTAQLNVSNTTESYNMFYECTKLSGYQGSKVTDIIDNTYARIDQGESAPGYFSPLNSKITYNLNGGKISSPIDEYTVLDDEITIPTPSRTDYSFLGWTATGAITQSTPTQTITIPKGTCGDIELTANWKLDISLATVKLSSDTYTSDEIPLVVTFNGTTLKKGVDYYDHNNTVKNAGSYEIVIAGRGQYTSYKTVSLYVKKYPITLTSEDKTKVYGEPDPEFTYTLSREPLGSDKINVTLQRYEGEDVGSYFILDEHVSAANPNYNITHVCHSLTITPKAVTVTPKAGQTKTYGDDDPEFEYEVEGLVGEDKLSGALARTEGYNVGTYAFKQGTLNDKNYSITLVEGSEFSITPKNITVKAKDITKNYGDDDPVFEYEVEGLLEGDKLYGSLSRAAGEEIGEHDITLGDLSNPNYNITFVGAKLTITKKNIDNPIIELESDVCILNDEGKAEPAVTIYDGTTPLSSSDYLVEYINNDKVGTATIKVTQKDGGNYTFTQTSKDFKIIDKTDACSITYMTGDKVEKTVYTISGKTITQPFIVKEGYTIEGVFKDEDLAQAWDFDNDVVDGNITLHLKWKTNSHKVSFMIDGEAYGEAVTLDYGTEITYPVPDAKEGFTFSGWNPAPATMPDYDFTAEGTYQRNVLHITYTIDGKEHQTFDVEYGTKITILNDPSNYGYTFSGWTPASLPSTMPNEDITVTGSFIPNKHTLVFYADGKDVKTEENVAYGTDITTLLPTKKYSQYIYTVPPTGITMPDFDISVNGHFDTRKHTITYMLDDDEYTTEEVEAGSIIALINNPTREGYTFSGWKSDYTEMPDEDITVTGSFARNKHKLTFKENDTELKTIEVTFGESVKDLIPTKKGYEYVPSTEIPETMPDKDLVIEGAFELITYKLVYYVNNIEYLTKEYHYGDEIIPEAEPVWPGYKFSGWTEIPATMPDDYYVVIGTFSVVTYLLTYSIDGEVYKTFNKTYNQPIDSIRVTDKEGYTFTGWTNYIDRMPEHDVTINGSRSVNKYTITYKVNGEIYKSVETVYGTEIVAEENPTREGYTFSGWDYIPTKMPDSDLIVSGTFTKKENGEPTPVANVTNADNTKVWSFNRTIFIETLPDTKYTIIDLSGRIITTSTTKSSHEEIQTNASGILIVTVGAKSFKVMN